MSKKNLSVFISLILRHKPEEIGITLDEHGWANVDELIDGINASGIQIGVQNNVHIGNGTVIKNSVISSNVGVVVIGNEVTIDGVKMPPCPAKGRNSTIIDNKVYIDGYELIDGRWRRTLRALWHMWF